MRALYACVAVLALAGCGGSAPLPPEPSALLDPDVAADDVFTVGEPDPARVDVAALRHLVDAAARYRSDGLLVAVDDQIVVERYFGQPRGAHNIQSVTKSVVSLAIGALVDDGRIASLDEPVGDFYADWQSGDKARVTLRELLTHTSGLHDDGDVLAADDTLAYVRALPLSHAPGHEFDYSNAGVQLLSGVIATAGGMDADALVRRRYFDPMGITMWRWEHDAAGNVATPGGLYLTPRELLRLGRLMRDGGAWNGAQLVSAAWVAASGAPGGPATPCYGLLWWLSRDGCDTWQPPYGPTRAFYALGWGGQYIVIVPSAHLLAVRTRDPLVESQAEEEATFFAELPDLVVALAR